mmetsp:Transcript_65420/g.116431  ORF Transcript_65420/g.116431 Transcript_65420/m.116431 type:complete len:205 (+) Transcript_65420:1139-1753(+)
MNCDTSLPRPHRHPTLSISCALAWWIAFMAARDKQWSMQKRVRSGEAAHASYVFSSRMWSLKLPSGRGLRLRYRLAWRSWCWVCPSNGTTNGDFRDKEAAMVAHGSRHPSRAPRIRHRPKWGGSGRAARRVPKGVIWYARVSWSKVRHCMSSNCRRAFSMVVVLGVSMALSKKPFTSPMPRLWIWRHSSSSGVLSISGIGTFRS